MIVWETGLEGGLYLLKRPAGRVGLLHVLRQQQQADGAVWGAALLLAMLHTGLPAQKAADERATCC